MVYVVECVSVVAVAAVVVLEGVVAEQTLPWRS